jgi:cytochrome c oxidase subunit 3
MSVSAAAAAHHSDEVGHGYTTTGLPHRKIAIWAFIGSECMLFASLISTYLIYKGRSITGPFPHEAWTDPSTHHTFKAILNIPVTSCSTFVLLMSSLAMVLALAAVENRDVPKHTMGERILGNSKLWLFTTALLGATFLGFQAYEFTSFVHEGLKISTNLFGSTFFTLTGFHGAHVISSAGLDPTTRSTSTSWRCIGISSTSSGLPSSPSFISSNERRTWCSPSWGRGRARRAPPDVVDVLESRAHPHRHHGD